MGLAGPERAVAFVEGVADEFAHALAGRDGSTRQPRPRLDGRRLRRARGDNLRQWAERFGRGPRGGGPDGRCLRPRRPRSCPGVRRGRRDGRAVVVAAQRLRVGRGAPGGLDQGAVLRHVTRGEQRAVDVAGNNAHDAFHHLHDVRRALGLPGRPVPLRLTGDGVVLRRSTTDDVDRITAWLADPAVHGGGVGAPSRAGRFSRSTAAPGNRTSRSSSSRRWTGGRRPAGVAGAGPSGGRRPRPLLAADQQGRGNRSGRSAAARG